MDDYGHFSGDILEQGTERAHRFTLPGWRPPRGAVILAAVTLAVGLGAGYLVGRQQGAHGAAAAAAPRATTAQPTAVPPTGPPGLTFVSQPATGVSFDLPPLTQQPGACSAQVGQDYELGIPVVNNSPRAIPLHAVTPVSGAKGMLEVLSWQWNPCGYNGAGATWEVSGITSGAEYLQPGQGAWLTVTVKPLVTCPAGVPVQFRVTYSTSHGQTSMMLPGFNDLSSVHFPGCATRG